MRTFLYKFLRHSLESALFFSIVGCGQIPSESFNDFANSALNGRKSLYVVSGSCYGGGVTLSTGASTITSYDSETGLLKRVIVDYNSFSPGDFPISIVNFDETRILVLVENAGGGRRLDIVAKDGSSVTGYLFNATALSAVLRRLEKASDGSLLVSKSTAIEKFSSAKARILQGANPYVNAPAGACATTATLISGIALLPNGKILYSHAAASPNNKIAMISAAGYAAAGDCLTSQAAPTTTALPTSLLYHSSGKLLASYGSATAASNVIYSYNVDAGANSISGATSAFSDASIVNGPSAMTEDPSTGDVFVSNGNSAFNNVERFSFNSTTGVLTRKGAAPFILPNIYTRCISDMKVISE